jgi:hypothetical protein
VGQVQFFSDNVRGTTRQDAQSHGARGDAVDDFVDGSISTADDYKIFPGFRGGPRQFGCATGLRRSRQAGIDAATREDITRLADLDFAFLTISARYRIIDKSGWFQWKALRNLEADTSVASRAMFG